jgi:hypothetical protein
MSEESDYQDRFWKGEQPEPGNRHRKRRRYRKLRVVRCKQLIVEDSYGRPRIVADCVDGKEPDIALYASQRRHQVAYLYGAQHGAKRQRWNI